MKGFWERFPRDFNRVCCLCVLCFANVLVFIMLYVYVLFFGLMVLITPSSISDCTAWYVWLAYINLNQCSNSVTASYIQIKVPFSIASDLCVLIFFTVSVPIQPGKHLREDLWQRFLVLTLLFVRVAVLWLLFPAVLWLLFPAALWLLFAVGL